MVQNYEIAPNALAPVVSIFVIGAEIVLGVLLLTGFAARGAEIGTALLLTMFAGAVGLNLVRDRAISCGCGFGDDSEISWRHVGLDLLAAAALIAIAIAGLRSPAQSLPFYLFDLLVLMGVAVWRHLGQMRSLMPPKAVQRAFLEEYTKRRCAPRVYEGAGMTTSATGSGSPVASAVDGGSQ